MIQIFGAFDGIKTEISRQLCHYDKKHDIEASLIGEIFNHKDLNKQLNDNGFHFNSDNLAEFLINAYENWGVKCPNEFIGRFSLSVHDLNKKSFFIARDHVGLKPLYYSNINGKFAYSSELASLININWIPKNLDLDALNFFFAYRFIPDDMTIYKHIRKIPAGSAILYNYYDNSIQKWHYWDPPNYNPNDEDENSVLVKLDKCINDSLIIRINGRNSPGVFLSGGLDSSLMVALMSKYVDNPVKTFSIGFEMKKYDETPYCRIISDHFNTEHHEIIVSPDFDELLKIINIFDEPFANPSIIPNYYAVRAASGEVNSIITGDGADGLFLGLRTHLLSVQHSRRNNFIPTPLWKGLNSITNLIPDEAKWKIFLQYLTPEDFFKMRSLVYGINLRKKLLAPWIQEDLKDSFYEPENNITKTINQYHGSFMDKIGYATFKADADDSFFKTDRIANKLSINIRTPFLDKRLIEFAFSFVHSNMKIRGNITKYIIKKYARNLLPSELPIERKRGFNPPFSEWLKKQWWPQTRDLLMDGNDNYLDKKYIEKLLKLHKHGIFNQGRTIFALLCFRVWENNHMYT